MVTEDRMRPGSSAGPSGSGLNALYAAIADIAQKAARHPQPELMDALVALVVRLNKEYPNEAATAYLLEALRRSERESQRGGV